MDSPPPWQTFEATHPDGSVLLCHLSPQAQPIGRNSKGPSRPKGCSPEMDVTLGGDRTMVQSREGGDTRPGAWMGATTQAGRKFGEGPVVELEGEPG